MKFLSLTVQKLKAKVKGDNRQSFEIPPPNHSIWGHKNTRKVLFERTMNVMEL